jgi:16S rRNA (uracil1498-N3)-methyltransferase
VECLYAPAMTAESSVILLYGDEQQHARALRLRGGEVIMLTNGIGLCAKARVQEVRKNEMQCAIENLLPNHAEHPYRLIAALGVLDNRERTEFAIEKAVELGAHDFVPLLSINSERDRTKADRLQAKILAATKQCKRARLMKLHSPQTLADFLQFLPNDAQLVLADTDGASPLESASSLALSHTIAVAVGAEGGFTTDETVLLQNAPNSVAWNLAPARLRAETALLAGLSNIVVMRTLPDGGR